VPFCLWLIKQRGKKEERINQLQEELQETVKELTATRSMLKTAMEERDLESHEVAHLRKANKDLTDDLTFLHKRVEMLDEDLLIKDGQISILKESVDKPLRELCFE
jgi:chaperonin cofactor prefoldin